MSWPAWMSLLDPKVTLIPFPLYEPCSWPSGRAARCAGSRAGTLGNPWGRPLRGTWRSGCLAVPPWRVLYAEGGLGMRRAQQPGLVLTAGQLLPEGRSLAADPAGPAWYGEPLHAVDQFAGHSGFSHATTIRPETAGRRGGGRRPGNGRAVWRRAPPAWPDDGNPSLAAVGALWNAPSARTARAARRNFWSG